MISENGQVAGSGRAGMGTQDSELQNEKGQESWSDENKEPHQLTDNKHEKSSTILDISDEDEVLNAIRNNHQKVEAMIRNRKIPKQSTMMEAMKRDGHSKGVQTLLREMSKQLCAEIFQAEGVWCGYRAEDPNTPVFVVTLKDIACTLTREEVPESFINYELIIRHKYKPNDEEKGIVDQYGNESVSSEVVARINNCIATHRESLMKEHSNLSIIRACAVKASGYLHNKMEVIKDTCIVLYVPVKGIIPVGEKQFPKVIDGIVTDIREGEFVFYSGHSAMEHHSKLRMGCCTSVRGKIGTLGGFVDLPNEKVGCLVCAHQVLTDEEIREYILMDEEKKLEMNRSLAQGILQIDVFQPTPERSRNPFGRVHTVALNAGSEFEPYVDAAIIEITDDERKPETGNFPDGDFEDVGFTKEDPMLYNSGEIMDIVGSNHSGTLVMKFGCATGITRGYIECNEMSVRSVFNREQFYFPLMHGLILIRSCDFAEHGDTGALVFICVDGNIRNLSAVGMVVGGTSTGDCLCTPITTTFRSLGLMNNRFKVFPYKQISQQENKSQRFEYTIKQNLYADVKLSVVIDPGSLKRHLEEQDITQSFQATPEHIKQEFERDDIQPDTKKKFEMLDPMEFDLNPLDEDEFLQAVINNYQKVEEMIKNQNIPQQTIMRVALKRYGYSKGVQLALREMSKQLRTKISQAVGVWCGYRAEDPHTPVFVVTLKDPTYIRNQDKVPKSFINYEIIIRYKYVPNDEDKNIVEGYGNESIRVEDFVRMNNCIATHTEKLMKEHSNLSIIRACPVKASGYLRKKMEVIKNICIVLYVPVKGIIPFGERKFPITLDGIVTDIREGEFLFFEGHNAMEYHQKLRMGCSIGKDKCGTLGGFVDLPGGKVGCLTAAHVVLTDDKIKEYILMDQEQKQTLSDKLTQEIHQIEIHQPKPLPNLKPFGTVHSIALHAGDVFTPSVDAAIIEITDDERKPDSGTFPEGDFENAGFTKDNPMLYTSGDIMDHVPPSQKGSLLIKFGCTTGITRGCIGWIGTSLRPVDLWGDYCFPVMYRQWEIEKLDFAAPGDSGALCFLCVGGNNRNLHAIGMVIGGSSTRCSCFITPIKAVFEKLILTVDRFKDFQGKQVPQQEITTERLSDRRGDSSAIDSVNNRVTSLEQTVARGFDSCDTRFVSIEQKITEGFNGVTELLQNLQRP